MTLVDGPTGEKLIRTLKTKLRSIGLCMTRFHEAHILIGTSCLCKMSLSIMTNHSKALTELTSKVGTICVETEEVR